MARHEHQRFFPREALLAAVAGALLWVGAMGFERSLQAQDEPSTESEKPLSPAVEQKLNQALQNDEAILGRFQAVMDEVEIVKVRVLRQPQAPQ